MLALFIREVPKSLDEPMPTLMSDGTVGASGGYHLSSKGGGGMCLKS